MTSSARASNAGGTVQADLSGGREIDDELKFRGLFDRQLGGFRTAGNPMDVIRPAAERFAEARPITH
jgi:hypothetical protein